MTRLITLQQIRDKHPCKGGWTNLLKTLGNPGDLSMQVSFGDIAKSNGVADALWCLRCLDMDDIENRRFAGSLIMPAVKRASKHTSDHRVHDCIAAVEKWLAGDDTVDLKKAAATAADAAADAAAAAAYAAYAARAAATAADAARAAAFATAYAARAAAFAAEREQQALDIIERSPLHALADSALTKTDKVE